MAPLPRVVGEARHGPLPPTARDWQAKGDSAEKGLTRWMTRMMGVKEPLTAGIAKLARAANAHRAPNFDHVTPGMRGGGGARSTRQMLCPVTIQ